MGSWPPGRTPRRYRQPLVCSWVTVHEGSTKRKNTAIVPRGGHGAGHEDRQAGELLPYVGHVTVKLSKGKKIKLSLSRERNSKRVGPSEDSTSPLGSQKAPGVAIWVLGKQGSSAVETVAENQRPSVHPTQSLRGLACQPGRPCSVDATYQVPPVPRLFLEHKSLLSEELREWAQTILSSLCHSLNLFDLEGGFVSVSQGSGGGKKAFLLTLKTRNT